MTRRALLAAAPAVLALTACGASDDPRPDDPPAKPGSETARRGDAELLAMLIEVKSAARAAYEAVDDAPRRLAEHEREHLDRLSFELRKLDPDLPAPERGAAPAGELGDLVDAEDTCVAAYIDALPKVSDPGLRALVASMLAADAAHASALRGRLRQSRTPDAFVYGRRAS